MIAILMTLALICAQTTDDPLKESPLSVSVASSLLVEQAAIGDTAEVLIIALFGDNPALWLFDTLEPPFTTGLDFIGTKTQTITRSRGNYSYGETRVRLLFTPNRTGELTISPWKWRLLHLVPGDTAKIDTFVADLPGFALTGLPRKEKITTKYLPFFLTFIGIAMFIAFGIFIRIFAKKVMLKPKEKPPLTAEEKALDKISKLSPQRLQAEELLDKLAHVLRSYISEKFGIDALGMSSEEILSALSNIGFAGHRFVALQQVLKYCDDVRFAKKYPESQELWDIIEQGRIFIKG